MSIITDLAIIILKQTIGTKIIAKQHLKLLKSCKSKQSLTYQLHYDKFAKLHKSLSYSYHYLQNTIRSKLINLIKLVTTEMQIHNILFASKLKPSKQQTRDKTDYL